MSRHLWRDRRAPLPIQPMETDAGEILIDRICFAVALVGGLTILGRVALHFIWAAVS